jgi:hypothetical protein
VLGLHSERSIGESGRTLPKRQLSIRNAAVTNRGVDPLFVTANLHILPKGWEIGTGARTLRRRESVIRSTDRALGAPQRELGSHERAKRICDETIRTGVREWGRCPFTIRKVKMPIRGGDNAIRTSAVTYSICTFQLLTAVADIRDGNSDFCAAIREIDELCS